MHWVPSFISPAQPFYYHFLPEKNTRTNNESFYGWNINRIMIKEKEEK
jgi:hypothetical protein